MHHLKLTGFRRRLGFRDTSGVIAAALPHVLSTFMLVVTGLGGRLGLGNTSGVIPTTLSHVSYNTPMLMVLWLWGRLRLGDTSGVVAATILVVDGCGNRECCLVESVVVGVGIAVAGQIAGCHRGLGVIEGGHGFGWLLLLLVWMWCEFDLV